MANQNPPPANPPGNPPTPGTPPPITPPQPPPAPGTTTVNVNPGVTPPPPKIKTVKSPTTKTAQNGGSTKWVCGCITAALTLLGLVYLVQLGPNTQLRTLYPNGISAMAPTIIQPLVTLTNITIVQQAPPQQAIVQPEAPATTAREENIDLPDAGQKSGYWITKTVSPYETLTFHIAPGWQVTDQYDVSRVEKTIINFDYSTATTKLKRGSGVSFKLFSPYEEKQDVSLYVEPICNNWRR